MLCYYHTMMTDAFFALLHGKTEKCYILLRMKDKLLTLLSKSLFYSFIIVIVVTITDLFLQLHFFSLHFF